MGFTHHIFKLLAPAAFFCLLLFSPLPENAAAPSARTATLSPPLCAVKLFDEDKVMDAVFRTALNPSPAYRARADATVSAFDDLGEGLPPVHVDPDTAAQVRSLPGFAYARDFVDTLVAHVRTRGAEGIESLLTDERMDRLDDFLDQADNAYMPVEKDVLATILIARFTSRRESFAWMNNTANFAETVRDLARRLDDPLEYGDLVDRIGPAGNNRRMITAFLNTIQESIINLQKNFSEYRQAREQIDNCDLFYWNVDGETSVWAVFSRLTLLDQHCDPAELEQLLSRENVDYIRDFVRRAMLVPISPYDEARMKLFTFCTLVLMRADFPGLFYDNSSFLVLLEYVDRNYHIELSTETAKSSGSIGFLRLLEAQETGNNQTLFFLLAHELSHLAIQALDSSPAVANMLFWDLSKTPVGNGINELHSDLMGIFFVQKYGTAPEKILSSDKFAEYNRPLHFVFGEEHQYAVNQTLALYRAGYEFKKLIDALHRCLRTYDGPMPELSQADRAYIFPLRLMRETEAFLQAA